jgi:hypothetical protein
MLFLFWRTFKLNCILSFLLLFKAIQTPNENNRNVSIFNATSFPFSLCQIKFNVFEMLVYRSKTFSMVDSAEQNRTKNQLSETLKFTAQSSGTFKVLSFPFTYSISHIRHNILHNGEEKSIFQSEYVSAEKHNILISINLISPDCFHVYSATEKLMAVQRRKRDTATKRLTKSASCAGHKTRK